MTLDRQPPHGPDRPAGRFGGLTHCGVAYRSCHLRRRALFSAVCEEAGGRAVVRLHGRDSGDTEIIERHTDQCGLQLGVGDEPCIGRMEAVSPSRPVTMAGQTCRLAIKALGRSPGG